MVRKSLLVALILLCSAVALLLSAGRPAGPAKYLGYWRSADEMRSGGPLLILITDSDGEVAVMGFPLLGDAFDVVSRTDHKLTLEAPTGPGMYENIIFDTDQTGATMRIVFVPVEDPGIAGVPETYLEMVRATGPEAELAAELAAQVERQNRPPEQIVTDNARILSDAIEAWANDHDGRYPPPQVVGVGSELARYMEEQWPINPVSGTPMQFGGGAGDFSYATDGESYRLVVNMPDGTTLTLP